MAWHGPSDCSCDCPPIDPDRCLFDGDCPTCPDGQYPAYNLTWDGVSSVGLDDCDCTTFIQFMVLYYIGGFSGCEYNGYWPSSEGETPNPDIPDCFRAVWEGAPNASFFVRLILGGTLQVLWRPTPVSDPIVLVSYSASEEEWDSWSCQSQITLQLDSENPDELFGCNWPADITLFPHPCVDDCSAAPEGAPYELAVDLSAIVDDGCLDCGDLNAVYVVTQTANNPCRWRLSGITPICEQVAAGSLVVAIALHPSGDMLLVVRLEVSNEIILWSTVLPADTDLRTLAAESIAYNSITSSFGNCDATVSTCLISAV